jgi:hypothetical protein
LSVELISYTFERQTNQGELGVSKLEAHIVEKNNGCMVLFGMLEGKRSMEDLGVDGRKIRNLLFKQYDGRLWTDSPGLEKVQC